MVKCERRTFHEDQFGIYQEEMFLLLFLNGKKIKCLDFVNLASKSQTFTGSHEHLLKVLNVKLELETAGIALKSGDIPSTGQN